MESREKILRAALRIFLEKGYDAASMNDVVRESKFTKGGIYHYFNNKEQLFIEAIDLLFREFEQWEMELYESSSSLQEIVRNYFNSLAGVSVFLNRVVESENINEYNFYMLMVDALVKFPILRQKHFEVHHRNQEAFIELLRRAKDNNEIRKDIECDTLAFMISALGEGTMIYHILNAKLDLKETGEKLFDTLWKSITP
ncbi:MAG: TetR/AcrR family transcriptional regulator [Candidatus Cloacimonetes bacterium]|nr:TetR/AcrR family transcriptional regulator [Candidatus Cloacimonadota bacterium]